MGFCTQNVDGVVDFEVVVVVDDEVVELLVVVPPRLVEPLGGVPAACGPAPPAPPGSSAKMQTVGLFTVRVTDADGRSTAPTAAWA